MIPITLKYWADRTAPCIIPPPAFLRIGFLLGTILSGIMLSVLGSSVDAIIVCYAEAPAELRENHPAIHAEMEATWAETWPDVVSTPVAVAVPLGGGAAYVRDDTQIT